MTEVVNHLKADSRFYEITREIDSKEVHFKCLNRGRSGYRRYSIRAQKEAYALYWNDIPVHISSELTDLTDFMLI